MCSKGTIPFLRPMTLKKKNLNSCHCPHGGLTIYCSLWHLLLLFVVSLIIILLSYLVHASPCWQYVGFIPLPPPPPPSCVMCYGSGCGVYYFYNLKKSLCPDIQYTLLVCSGNLEHQKIILGRDSNQTNKLAPWGSFHLDQWLECTSVYAKYSKQDARVHILLPWSLWLMNSAIIQDMSNTECNLQCDPCSKVPWKALNTLGVGATWSIVWLILSISPGDS